jgi:hypothetical protein
VTWYNAAGSGSFTFTPKISFTDPDYYNAGTGGTWYDMTQGVCPAGQSITTTYTFGGGTAGDYSLVNVCRYDHDGEEMVMDKIELTTSSGPTTYTLTVNSGSGDGNYEEEDVVNISADTAPSGMFFDIWTGDTDYVDDFQDPTTSVTMPAASVVVTARFAWVAAGLVSRYTFDVDASDSAGSNDGTLANGAAVATDGTRGKVLSLDGDDDGVVLPTSGLTAGRSELTLSMWIKPDENVGTNAFYDSHYNWYWQFAIRQDKWYTRDISTGTTGARDNDLTMPTLSVGEWQHLAFVYSASNDLKAIYLDGEPAASTSTSVDTLTSDRSGEVIGMVSDGTVFDGMLDDVRLYGRALSEGEIELLAGQ